MMRHHINRWLTAAAAAALLLSPAGLAAADVGSDTSPPGRSAQAELFQRPIPVMPVPTILFSAYERYLHQVELYLAQTDQWIEEVRAAASKREGQPRETMAQLARNVERQLESAEERLTDLKSTEITRRDSVRRALDEALEELDRAQDEARATLRTQDHADERTP